MARQSPTPHRTVIDRFGGFAALAQALTRLTGRRLAASTVQGWHQRGHISNHWQQAVFEAGQALKPPLAAGDFFVRPAAGGKPGALAALTQLGQGGRIPESPGAAVLETVANPQPGADYLVRFTAPEFTSLCPVTGQPDFAHLVIDYVPAKLIVESKSLKLYLSSFRNHGAFHEDCTLAVAKRLIAAAKPKWLRIGGYWYPRGGIPIDVFYQTGRLPKGLWVPDQGVPAYRGRG
ncbi:MAG: NADPH-dependent 7-cyano-7-deazaguanine reductase QueF [Rhodospirillales bacterium]|nr:NADPH-dependent 7-cyano-7-deazaguanine reductase QueF [Rhodospirillales bacterium]